MSEPVYACRSCGWEGAAHELETDTVETCMGPDVVETCPACGSPDVRLVYQLGADDLNEE